MLNLGDLVLLNFPYTNRVGSKIRPGLVVGINSQSHFSDLNIAYMTTEVDAYCYDSFAETITASDLESGFIKQESVVRLDKTIIADERICKPVARLKTQKIETVLRKLVAYNVENFCANKFKKQEFIGGETIIPPSGKVIDSAEIKNLVEASLDGWLTTGRFNDEFEKKLAEFLGVKFVLTVNSGSSANLVALSTLTSPLLEDRALKPGDEVITCATGFPTTVNPIIQNGLVPVFLDVEIPTYNIKAELIESAITPKTKAIMLAHTLGNPFNLDEVMRVAKKYNLWVIEDCCDALGSTYRGQKVGTFGDIATLSFYPAHHITMGEGGAVFTNNPKLKRIAESFRDWGRDCWCDPGKDNTCGKRFDWQLSDLPHGYDHKYTYSHIGYNLKITDMQAAVGLAQLDKLSYFIEARKKNFNFLYEQLTPLKKYLILPEPAIHSEPSWFGFPIAVKKDAPFDRKKIVQCLEKNKIGTRLLFGGNLIRQPAYKDCNYRIVENLSNSDFVMNQVFWIGVYPSLTDSMIDFILSQLEKVTS